MGKQKRRSKVAAIVKEMQEQDFIDGDYLMGHLMHLKQYPETQPEVYRKEHPSYDRYRTARDDNQTKKRKREKDNEE